VCKREGEASTNCSRGRVQKRLLQQRLRVPGSRRHSLHENKTTGRNRSTEAASGTVHVLRQSLKKKSLTIDDWGAMEGAAGTEEERGGKSREKKLRRMEDKRRRREGLLWLVVEEDCQLGCSAKVVSEARITQTGSLHFLMQACRWIVYFIIVPLTALFN